MTISYPMVKAIFNTLPIGYYLGRSIECKLSEDSRASYFNPAEDNIVISYPMIADAATELDSSVSGDELEQLIRGLLYHEISHVILTPRSLKVTPEINIVEDERIESVCKNLYMNTDFFDNIIKINHFNGEAPTNADSAFYQLVRFHVGTAEWLERCRNLLKKYAGLNSTSYSREYAYDVKEFYEEFIKWYNEKAEKENSDTNDKNSEGDESKEGNSSNENNSNNEEKSSKKTVKTTINQEEDDGESEDSSDGSSNGKDTSEEDDESTSSGNMEGTPAHNKPSDIDDISIDINDFKNIIKDTLNVYYNEALINTLTNIINKAMRKNKRNGSAINSYSGKFNVKAVGRDDYRWWVQQNREGHVRHNSNVHFNLFIDNSGSFCYNDDQMNQFIKALDKIEKSIPSFDFDVITINTKIVEWPNHNQIFDSHGGNCLLENIKDVIKKHQAPRANNYNIVLFDGDAHSDDKYCYRVSANDPFKYFNTPNTIIISDDDNKKYLDAVKMTQARVKYTNNYCKEFIGIICNLLEKVL